VKFSRDNIPLYVFGIQVVFSVSIFAFCLIVIAATVFTKGKRDIDPYVASLLSSTITWWFPSPAGQDRKDRQLIEHSDQTNIYPPE